MTTVSRKKRAAAYAAVAAAAAAVLLLATTILTILGGPAQALCSTHFYAYDAPAGSLQFGATRPDFTNLSDAEAAFKQKLSCDPLFLATVESFYAQGINLDASATYERAQALMADPDLRAETVEAVFAQPSSYALEVGPEDYETLGMVPGDNPSVMPALIKLEPDHPAGQVFVATLENGEKRAFRVPCDFQPIAPEFPHVPPPPSGPVCPWNPTLPPDDPNCLQPKDGVDSVDPVPGTTPAPLDDPEPVKPGPPANPAPVVTPGPAPTSTSLAPGANPAPSPTPAPTSGNAPGGSGGTCVPVEGAVTCTVTSP